MNVRYMLHFLRILKIPGLLSIMQDWQGLVRMHFLYAAYESGLLQALPCDKPTLLEKLHVTRPGLLDALLNVGLATKELGVKDRVFFIKGRRSRAITGSRGDILVAMIQANVTYYSDAYRNASGRLRGGELGDDLEEIGGLVARFSKIGEPLIKDFLRGIVSGKNPMRILDVGCGSGIFLCSAHDANPHATGLGLDVDEDAVRQARSNLAGWGIGGRFHVLHGDIRRPPGEVAGTFDLITLFNILYYFPEQDRVALLDGMRAMLSPGGRLAIAINCRGNRMDIGAANLNMVNCSLKGLSRLPSLDEIESLLNRCGFRRTDIHRFIPGSTFFGIVAVKA